MDQGKFKGWIVCVIVLLACCGTLSVNGAVDNDSVAMLREANAFLAKLPAGLQQLQAKAVAEAINGDYSLLQEVRNSRNNQPEYSVNVEVENFDIIGRYGRRIPVRLYSPTAVDDLVASLPLLLYFHGGGWTFGSLNSCARFCDAIAASGKAKVLAVDYALAPEHPYPAGLNDCEDAVGYAIEHYRELGVDRQKISVGGDSSGGNLALAVGIADLGDDKPAINSIILFYPVVIAENDGSESWNKFGCGFGLDAELMEKFNEAYCSDFPANTPAISPAYVSDWTARRLPPVLMINAERDILTSQGFEFASHLEALGCEIKHTVLPGTVHLFITVNGQDTAFSKSCEMTASFLERQTTE